MTTMAMAMAAAIGLERLSGKRNDGVDFKDPPTYDDFKQRELGLQELKILQLRSQE
ncbi:hypothetical protein [Crystallibacter degradans]|uniref:hypothetical protein n=1 Tax=Crystallibacter degradans TaxID=2726743 RepID=UPI0017997A48|nr:hypothetical protein [Arthrobacter sp. SF27]NMR28098.1 hypothetical protein [Arthrobacter sp. SF27]